MNNTSLLVSVVICTYNRAKLLHTCLQSLSNQTADRRLYEVIVVDNNSNDNTQYIAKSFIKNRPSFRLISETKQGLSHARNRGWKEAQGKYVAYIDDDAIANSDWIGQIVLFIQHHPHINAFGGPYDRYCRTIIPAWIPKNYFTLNSGNKTKELNLINEWISGSNMIFNKLIFKKYGGFKTDLGMKGSKILYGEETEFLLRLKKMEESVYYVPKIRVRHLVTEYKLHLWWLLKDNYWRSFSFTLLKKSRLSFVKGILSLILSLLLFSTYIINTKKEVFKRQLYYGLSNIFLSLGQIVGSIYH